MKEQLKIATDELLDHLKDRSKFVLNKRFGLDGGKVYTLESIGKEIEVSRERIRQIENSSLKLLRQQTNSGTLIMISNVLEDNLVRRGGFLSKEKFQGIILGKKADVVDQNRLTFLLNVFEEFEYQKDTVNFQGIWYLPSNKHLVGQLINFHEKLIKYFDQSKEVYIFEDILELVRSGLFDEKGNFFAGKEGEYRLKILLEGSNILQKNIIDEWGLAHWGIISQKYVKERAFLIFKKYKKPLHFRELTEYINKHWDDKRTLPQTVHNVIIKYEEFSFVRQGTYILKEK